MTPPYAPPNTSLPLGNQIRWTIESRCTVICGTPAFLMDLWIGNMLHADGVDGEALVAAHAGGEGQNFGIAVILCVQLVPELCHEMGTGVLRGYIEEITRDGEPFSPTLRRFLNIS